MIFTVYSVITDNGYRSNRDWEKVYAFAGDDQGEELEEELEEVEEEEEFLFLLSVRSLDVFLLQTGTGHTEKWTYRF